MQFFGSGSDSAAAEADEVELEQTMKDQMELPDDVKPDFLHDFDPDKGDTKFGNELKAYTEDGDGPYAGEWVRNIFEGAYHDDEQGVFVGHDPLEAEPHEVGISHKAWFRHCAIFGQTGHGKTSVLKNIMVQRAYQGYGFTFVDPKGEACYEILRQLPEHRLDDLVWVDPDPDESDYIAGMNFIDVGDSDGNEITRELEDLKGALADEDYWGVRMDRIYKTVMRGMMQSDHPFTLLHFYHLLDTPEFQEKLAESIEDPAVKANMENLVEMNQDKFDPVLSRLQEWVENPQARRIVAQQESSFSMREIIEEDKILIVNAKVSESVRKPLTTAFLRNIWSVINSRSGGGEYDPYYLFLDEFNDIVSTEAKIQAMLSKARQKRLSVTICNQYPSQLPAAIQEEMLGNVQNYLSLNPGEPSDARTISKKLRGPSDEELMDLSRFNLMTQIEVNGELKDPFIVKTFADYPPVRTREDVNDIIVEKLENNGTHIDEIREYADQSPEDLMPDWDEEFQTETDSDSDEDNETSDTDGLVANDIILEAAYAACIQEAMRQGEDDLVFTESENVKREIRARIDNDYSSRKLSNEIEKMPEKHIEQTINSGKVSVKITPDGRSKVMEFDTGEAETGGNDSHRYTLRRAFEEFTKAGYLASLPSQEGDEQPDGLADSPIDMSASSVKEFEEKLERLQSEYPNVYEISRGQDVSIEAETTTFKDPAHMMNNMRKAVNQGNVAVMAVKDASYKSSQSILESDGVNILNTLKKPAFVKAEDNGETVFYNHRNMTVEWQNKEFTPVFNPRASDKDENLEWVEQRSGTVVARKEGSHREIAKFGSRDELEDPNPKQFAAWYRYDHSEARYIVKSEVDGEIQTYTYNNREKFADSWEPVKSPYIVEHEFNHVPEDDDWVIVVFPDDDKDLPVMKIEYEGINPTGDIQYSLIPLLQEERDGWTGLDRDTTRDWYVRPDPNPAIGGKHILDPDTLDGVPGDDDYDTLCSASLNGENAIGVKDIDTISHLCSDCREEYDSRVN